MLVSKLPECIQRQDEMTSIMGKSLKKMAKKIHRLELMLHNEPTYDAETHERKIWETKMDKLLHYDVAKRLPTLKEIQLARRQEEAIDANKNASRIRKKTKKKITLYERKKRESMHLKAAKKAAAIAASKQSEALTSGEKTIRGGAMSAPACDGSVIGVIKNYKGMNTSCGNERTLHRMDGRHSKLSATTALPDWIGPGYYADALASKDSGTDRPDSSFQVSFRNTGRVLKNAEHHKAARLEQLSKSHSFVSMDDDMPNYSRPSTCDKDHSFHGRSYDDSCNNTARSHEDHEGMDELFDNPWSTSSAKSTIGRPSSQSGRQSPQRVIIHSPKKSVCAYESVISEFIGLSTEQSTHSIGMDDSVNVNTLDSLVLKAADVDKRRYINNDFAKGGLDLQGDIPVLTLDEFGEVSISTANDNRKGGELSNTLPKKSQQHQSKHHHHKTEERPKSKAQKMLSNIKQDLSQHRTSFLRDKNISFTDSLDFIIDDWQASENVSAPSKYGKSKSRQKKASGGGGGEVAPDAVNLDQLLMDDTGMSFEEAKSLVEEYSQSIQL